MVWFATAILIWAARMPWLIPLTVHTGVVPIRAW
jgi:hypothetical protein